MKDILTTNVLIIGKSGVGKSSLLNYIFDQEVEKTGSGRPVTEEGIYEHTYEMEEDFHVKIHDTWGLEANKASKWKKIIIDEVKNHDCMEVHEWFHTIVYCFSAKSARIEEFETSIIKELMESKNRVVIALTHFDVNNVDNAIKEMTTKLISIGVVEKNIIQICSVGKKLLSGKVTKPSGKNEILACIKDNMWENIVVKLVAHLNDMGTELINDWKTSCKSYVDNTIKIYNYHSNKVFKNISQYCNAKAETITEDMNLHYKQKMMEAFTYYNRISEKLAVLTGSEVKEPYFDNKFKMYFSMDFGDKLVENIASFIMMLIPFLGWVTPIAAASSKRDEIKSKIDFLGNNLIDEHNDNMKRIEEQLLYIM